MTSENASVTVREVTREMVDTSQTPWAWPVTRVAPKVVTHLGHGIWATECPVCHDVLTADAVGSVNSRMARHTWRMHNIAGQW